MNITLHIHAAQNISVHYGSVIGPLTLTTGMKMKWSGSSAYSIGEPFVELCGGNYTRPILRIQLELNKVYFIL